MKKKPNSRRFDFIPNRLNKYSIRKFTVGTASILIGSLMFLGTGQADAAEDETKAVQTTDLTSTDADAEAPQADAPVAEVETTELQTTPESTETPQVTAEEVTTEETTTEEATTEAAVEASVKATDVKFSEDNKTLTGYATAGDKVVLTLADGTQKEVTADSEGKFEFADLNVASGEAVKVVTVNADQVQSEAVEVTANVISEVSTEEATTEEVTTEAPSTEEVASEEPTSELPTTEVPSSEVPTTEVPSAEEVTTEAPQSDAAEVVAPDAVAMDTALTEAATADDKEAVATQYYAESTGVTEEQAIETIEALGLDYNTATNEDITAALLQAIVDKQNSETVEATPATFAATAFANGESLAMAANEAVAAAVSSGAGNSKPTDTIESGATTAVNSTVNGKVVVQWKGNPTNIDNTTVATPLEGVRIYAQWFEKDGTASPIYTTTSAADGTYHIVLEDFTDKDGKIIDFDADPNLPEGEKWRVWAETPAGMTLYYSWENSQLGPQDIVMDTSFSAGNLVTTDKLVNMNFIYVPQTNNAVMHDLKNVDADNVHIDGEQGYVQGKVFWNK